MAEGIELAKAYVQIIPSAKGIKGNIASAMDDEANDAGKSAGGKFGSVFGDVLKANLVTDVVRGAFNAVTDLAKEAASAVGSIVKDAVSGYAEYEQLAGGVETLFKDSADTVLQHAENAYKTAGMTANDYMETATSFSASLLQGLGGDTEKAAQVTDVAISDMSDNMNKMGSSMESIKNAYMGFSKQNYTMLDNLKLGYGGTKTEMERLLADAEQFSGVHYDISNLADVYNAIHVIQEEMGITGTTALEASETISGSAGSVKAAWENLIAGLANDNADLDTLIDNVIVTAEAAFNNILPIVEKALVGLAGFVEKVAPIIAEKLPTIVEQVLPSLLSAAESLIKGVANALPDIIKTLADVLPQFIDLGLQIIGAIGQGLMDNIDVILKAAGDLISGLFDKMLEATEGDGTSVLLKILDWIVKTFEDNYRDILSVGRQILINVVQGITENLPDIIKDIAELVKFIADILIDNMPLLIKSAAEVILALATGIAEALPDLIPAVVDVVIAIVDALLDNIDLIIDAAIALILGLTEGLINALPKLIEKAPVIVEKLVQALIRNAPKLAMAAVQVVVELAKAIVTNLPKIVESGYKIITSIINGIRDYLGKLPEYGKQIIETVWNGFKTLDPVQWGKDLIDSFVNGILSNVSAVWDAVKGIAGGIADFIGFSEPDKGPLSNFHTFAPDMMNLFAQGIDQNIDTVERSVARLGTALSDTMTGDFSMNAAGGKQTSLGGVSIVVNAAPGQDEETIARKVADLINQQVRSTEAVFA